jgi:hypothetical protein
MNFSKLYLTTAIRRGCCPKSRGKMMGMHAKIWHARSVRATTVRRLTGRCSQIHVSTMLPLAEISGDRTTLGPLVDFSHDVVCVTTFNEWHSLHVVQKFWILYCLVPYETHSCCVTSGSAVHMLRSALYPRENWASKHYCRRVLASSTAYAKAGHHTRISLIIEMFVLQVVPTIQGR